MHYREQGTAEIVRTRPATQEDAAPMPSEDQPFFDESLREGLRGLGRLVRNRRRRG